MFQISKLFHVRPLTTTAAILVHQPAACTFPQIKTNGLFWRAHRRLLRQCCYTFHGLTCEGSAGVRKKRAAAEANVSENVFATSEFSKAQVQIILKAERLFAEGSIDSVSLREIAAKAGMRNHFAVQYHFGSREDLVRSVFRYRMLQMEERRGQMLMAAERSGTLHDIRALLEIIFLPQLDVVDSDGNHSYAGFLCQYLLRERFQEFGYFGIPLPRNLERVLGLLRIRLGYLPSPAAQRRLIGACLVFLNILVSYRVSTEGESAVEEPFEEALSDTLSQIEVAISAPLKPAPLSM
jgi:AcrR family transcriptional regulator